MKQNTNILLKSVMTFFNMVKIQRLLLKIQMISIIFADMLSNQKLQQIVTELFPRRRKLNISLVFIIQSYFAVPKNTRLNSMHYFL